MADPVAAAVYRYMGLPVPKRERLVKVYINAKDIQPAVLEGYADKLAATVVTAVMVQGATRIELHFPNRQTVTIDADTIKRQFAAELGFWPQHRMAPAKIAVTELARLGSHFEPWAPMVTVPAQIHATPDGVSGDEPAQGEP